LTRPVNISAENGRLSEKASGKARRRARLMRRNNRARPARYRARYSPAILKKTFIIIPPGAGFLRIFGGRWSLAAANLYGLYSTTGRLVFHPGASLSLSDIF